MAYKLQSEWMTVDTGWNTGYAIWSPSGDLITVGKISLPGGKKAPVGWDRFNWMFREWSALLRSRPGLNRIIVETPEVWGGSALSHAASVRGDLTTLSYLIGVYSVAAFELGIEYQGVTVMQWKGQMSKDVCAVRVRKAIGFECKTDHIVDAVGIGLHFQQKL